MKQNRSFQFPFNLFFFRSCVIGHACQNNCFFLLLSWLPTYFHDTFPDAKVKLKTTFVMFDVWKINLSSLSGSQMDTVCTTCMMWEGLVGLWRRKDYSFKIFVVVSMQFYIYFCCGWWKCCQFFSDFLLAVYYVGIKTDWRESFSFWPEIGSIASKNVPNLCILLITILTSSICLFLKLF